MLIDYSCPVLTPPDPLNTLVLLCIGLVSLFTSINLLVIDLNGTTKFKKSVYLQFFACNIKLDPGGCYP